MDDDKNADCLYKLSHQFTSQIKIAMDQGGLKYKDIAERMGLTPGRVSQIMHDPGNITLSTMIKLGNAVGLKTSVLLYDYNYDNLDDDHIIPSVFRACWRRLGSPKNMLDIYDDNKPVGGR